MDPNTPSSKPNKPIPIWLIILGAILFLVLFLKSLFKKEQKEKLEKRLRERKLALEDAFKRIEVYRKEKAEVKAYLRKMTVFIRCFAVLILILFNTWYILTCCPESVTLRSVFECIATLNSVLLFGFGTIVFLRYGNFLHLHEAYKAVQNLILKKMFHKRMETIEVLLKSNLEDRDAIRKEIEEIETALKAIEEVELNSQPKLFSEDQLGNPDLPLLPSE